MYPSGGDRRDRQVASRASTRGVASLPPSSSSSATGQWSSSSCSSDKYCSSDRCDNDCAPAAAAVEDDTSPGAGSQSARPSHGECGRNSASLRVRRRSGFFSSVVLCSIMISVIWALVTGMWGISSTRSNGGSSIVSATMEESKDGSAIEGKRLETARLYGGIHDYAYYFADVLIGTPPQRQSVIVDTGSSLLGFPCRKCAHCGRHIDAPFDFTKSKTAEWVNCRDDVCHTGCGVEDRCRYSQRYSEGSSISGHYFRDVVALGDVERSNEFVWFDHLGCHNKETNLFTNQKANGIMGVSFPRKGWRGTIVDALFGSTDVDTRVFALCIGDEGGLMTVGGYNSTFNRPSDTTFSSAKMRRMESAQRLLYDIEGKQFRASTQTAQEQEEERQLLSFIRQGQEDDFSDRHPRHTAALLRLLAVEEESARGEGVPVAWTKVTSHDAYNVDVESISFMGEVLGERRDLGKVIVDSGTTFSYFPSPVSDMLMHMLKKVCQKDKQCRVHGKDEFCWTVKNVIDIEVPSFLIKFLDGSQVEWQPSSYLYDTGSGWCPAFEANNEKSTILGASFMKNKNVIFDRERDLIGFACAECPKYSATNRPLPPDPSVESEMRFAPSALANSAVAQQQQALEVTHRDEIVVVEEGVAPSKNSSPAIPPKEDNHRWVFQKWLSAAHEKVALVKPNRLWLGVGVVVSLVILVMVVIACQTVRRRPYTYTFMNESATDDDPGAIELADIEDMDLGVPPPDHFGRGARRLSDDPQEARPGPEIIERSAKHFGIDSDDEGDMTVVGSYIGGGGSGRPVAVASGARGHHMGPNFSTSAMRSVAARPPWEAREMPPPFAGGDGSSQRRSDVGATTTTAVMFDNAGSGDDEGRRRQLR